MISIKLLWGKDMLKTEASLWRKEKKYPLRVWCRWQLIKWCITVVTLYQIQKITVPQWYLEYLFWPLRITFTNPNICKHWACFKKVTYTRSPGIRYPTRVPVRKLWCNPLPMDRWDSRSQGVTPALLLAHLKMPRGEHWAAGVARSARRWIYPFRVYQISWLYFPSAE